MSRIYDVLAGPSEGEFTSNGLKMLCATPGESILEIGPGTGHSLVALSRSVMQNGKVIGLDLSDGMLREARKRVKGAGASGNIGLIAGDGAAIPIETETIDAIFTSFTLELFDIPEVPRVLSECYRILQKEGRLGTVSLFRGTNLAVKVYEWAHERIPGYIDCRPIYLEYYLKEAGFEICDRLIKSMWGLPVEIILSRKS